MPAATAWTHFGPRVARLRPPPSLAHCGVIEAASLMARAPSCQANQDFGDASPKPPPIAQAPKPISPRPFAPCGQNVRERILFFRPWASPRNCVRLRSVLSTRRRALIVKPLTGHFHEAVAALIP